MLARALQTPTRTVAATIALGMKPTTYEITVRGRLGATLVAAFDGLTASASKADTVLRGELPDQAGLYAVLDRIKSLGSSCAATSAGS